MDMDKSKQPGIAFTDCVVIDLKFHREPNVREKPTLDVEFDIVKRIADDKSSAQVELTGKVQETSTRAFEVNCTVLGQFMVVDGQENMSIEEFLDHNAPALLFPYVREAISNVTMRGGIKPIVLPPINVIALLSAKEQQLSST